MIRLGFRWIFGLWMMAAGLIAGAVTCGHSLDDPALQVSTDTSVYQVDTRTGAYTRSERPPALPRGTDLTPDHPWLVTRIGTINDVMFRVLHATTRTELLLGPYATPPGSATPYFWFDGLLWLITLSEDHSQTILRGLNPDAGADIRRQYTIDFPTTSTFRSQAGRWLMLMGVQSVRVNIQAEARGMVLVNIQTGSLVRIPYSPLERFDWSPSGWLFIAYHDAAIPTGEMGLQWFNPDTGLAYSTHAPIDRETVRWSPDGRFAAYVLVYEAIGIEPAVQEVFVLNLENLTTQSLLSASVPLWLYWSDDSRVLLIEQDSEPQHTLHVASTDPLTAHMIATLPLDGRLFSSLSAGGAYAAYDRQHDQGSRLFVLDLRSGRHRTVGTFPEPIQQIQWLKDKWWKR